MTETRQTVTDAWGRRYEITTVDYGEPPKEHRWGLMTGRCMVCGVTYDDYVESGKGCE